MTQVPSEPRGPQSQWPTGREDVNAGRTNWPRPIGILSIVLGLVGIVLGLLNLGAHSLNYVQRSVFSYLPSWFETFSVTWQIVGVILAAWLVVAGFMLLRRMHAAMSWHVIYGILSLLVLIISAIAFITVDKSRLQDIARGSVVASGILSAVLGAIYPAFLLTWFSQRFVRAQVAQWRGHGHRMPTELPAGQH